MARLARGARAIGVVFWIGCGVQPDVNGSDPPLFPADYAATYQEVRGCRFSLDHDLMRIRVFAAPDAQLPYTGRTEPFPTGAVVLKVAYEEDDTSCAGPIVNFTVMRKLDVGTSPALLDWEWQKVDANRHTLDNDPIRCANCHVDCGKPPEGYDGTCTVP